MIGVNTWLARSESLFADLRTAGLAAGLGHQLKVLRLLQLLEERGAAPKTPEALAQWIGPLLCSRSDQFGPLRQVLNVYFAEARAGRIAALTDIARAGQSIGSTRKRRFGLFWLVAVLAAVLAAGTAAALLFVRLPEVSIGGITIKPGPVVDVPASTLAASSVVIIALLAVVGFLLWRRIHLALRHGSVAGDANPQNVRIDEPASDHDNPQLLSSARVLNRPERQETGKLDVASTVRSTAEAGGRFSPVELIRRVPATWLLLVERGGPQDPLPIFGARLSTLLARSGVRHSLYEFRRSPEWVRGGPKRRHMPLERALAADRPTRVLMLAEASRAVDARTGGAASWLVDHDVPTPVVLLTPNARENWSAAESSAAQAGVLVLPADADGLSTLARRIQAAELEPTLLPPAQEAQFERWQAERFTWLSQSEPARATRDKLVDTLRKLLREDEFRLLVGIAAFPRVRLDLMATLDRKLHPHDPASAQRTRLLNLGRLVWVKEGIIPDWLRDDLMRALPGPQVREVRERWMELLADEPAPGDPASSLVIHLAEGSAEAGAALGDGLFLGFLRGKYDLPAPLRFVRLAGLWRAPDRIELLVAVAGVALAIAAFVVGLDIASFVEKALRAWRNSLEATQVAIRRIIPVPKDVWVAAVFVYVLVISYFAACTSRVKTPPLLAKWIASILPGVMFSKMAFITYSVLCPLLLVVLAWLGTYLPESFGVEIAATDFAAPLLIAAGIASLFLWRPIVNSSSAQTIEIIQQSRGTGLSDQPTLIVLLWLFLFGILDVVLLQSSEPLAWFTVVVAGLGLARAALISASKARLQPPFYAAADAARGTTVGVVLGQLAGGSLAWILWSNLDFFKSGLSQWFVNIGCMLFGAAVGGSIVLQRRGHISSAALYWFGLLALTTHGIQAVAAQLLSSSDLPSGFRAISTLPVMLATMLMFIRIVRPGASWRPYAVAVTALAIPTVALLVIELLGIAGTNDNDWALVLPLVLGTVATWPLVQRALTEEPAVASEPAGWRARPVAPALWVATPFVLLTALQIPIGPLRLDLSGLVIPVAILLAWRYGLRGYRTAILMVLPSLCGALGLDAVLPDALRSWFSPVGLDVAATALIAAALFARPGLFGEIRAASRLPRLVVAGLAVAVSLQISMNGLTYLGLATVQTPAQLQTPAQRNPTAAAGQPTEQVPARAAQRPRTEAGQSGRAEPPPEIAKQAAQSGSTGGGWAEEVQRGWIPATFVVFALFLIAQANLGRQAGLVLACLGAALGLALSNMAPVPGIGPISPVSPVVAAMGLFAYGVGRYHGRISRPNNGATDVGQIIAVLILLFLPHSVLSLVGTDEIRRLSPLLSRGDSEATFLTFAAVSAWTAGVRCGERRSLRIFAVTVLLMIPSLNVLNQFLQGSYHLGVLVLFLPMAAFLLGNRCRGALMQAAAFAGVAGAASRAPERESAGFLARILRGAGLLLRWVEGLLRDLRARSESNREIIESLAKASTALARILRGPGLLLRWVEGVLRDLRARSESMREKIERVANAWTARLNQTEQARKELRESARSSSQDPHPAPALARIMLTMLMWFARDSQAERLRQEARAPYVSLPHLIQRARMAFATDPAIQPLRAETSNDWCFVLAISHYVRTHSLPEADGAAQDFRDWACAPAGGSVPTSQATLVHFSEGHPSAADLERPLDRFLGRASQARQHNRIPRRLYVYLAGYTFETHPDEIGLLMPDVGTKLAFGYVSVQQLADKICQDGHFREVLFFVDGWQFPSDMRYLAEPLRPPFARSAMNDSLFYLVGAAQSLLSGNEIDRMSAGARSIFSRALVEGLRGAASNTSNLVTGSSLQSYLRSNLPLYARKERAAEPELYFEGAADIVIVDNNSAEGASKPIPA